MSKQTYTVAELQAMPDDDLNALAAELRGWTSVDRSTGNEYGSSLSFWWADKSQIDGNDDDYYIMPEREFLPATDRNQSRELLECARTKGAEFFIAFWRREPHVRYSISKNPLDWNTAYVTFYIEAIPLLRTIPGNDARAETIAFCAAMLAMAGKLA